MCLISFEGFCLDKFEKIWTNQPFLGADMARLGKCCRSGYGQIGVYRGWNHLCLSLKPIIKTKTTAFSLGFYTL